MIDYGLQWSNVLDIEDEGAMQQPTIGVWEFLGGPCS